MLGKLWDWLTDTPESRELDRQIEAADIRIAEKQKRLEDLEADCAAKRQEVEKLKETVNQYEQAINRRSN
ncbi:hypothetical protein I8752_22635 [Nostocaceae cyanobacterium CENA369]|uniref:Uncharacterized protein n=1 Tax=Dendronalium phyllosphericum CENA369 TaxID=1725256 RepID=A0A8J7IA41_9NOST|nr:hypothetical protein [Dendronalium phyllosphericum]MBH8575750.1 hypothetical protein [Dendronalium phyllosphericum CENA369]